MTSRINARHLLAFLIIALSGALGFFVFQNYRGGVTEEIVASLPRDIDLSLEEISYTETRDGIPRWTLVADSAAHSVGEGRTRIANVRMTFHDVDEQGDVTLTAREGTLRTETREVEVEGDVIVRSPQGYTFFTDRLEYRESDRRIRTEDPVRIVSETMELTGRGMLLDVEDRTFVLLRDVQGHWAERKGEG